MTHGQGVDFAIVCCSSPQAQADAVKMAKRLGHVMYFSGLARGLGIVPIDVEAIHRKEITVMGSRNAGRRHFMQAIEMLSESRLSFTKLITHVFPLERIAEGFEAAKSGEAMKVVISL